MAVADRNGLPIAVWTASGEKAERHLVIDTLDRRFLEEVPCRLIGDKAYDSDPLDRQLEVELGIEMISPNRSNRRRKTQDGRQLGRH